MNWIDIAIVIVVFFQAATGLRKGFARSLLDLAGIVAAVVISLTQFGLVSDFLIRLTGISTGWLHWFSLFACLVLSLALVNTVTAWPAGRYGALRRPFSTARQAFCWAARADASSRACC